MRLAAALLLGCAACAPARVRVGGIVEGEYMVDRTKACGSRMYRDARQTRIELTARWSSGWFDIFAPRLTVRLILTEEPEEGRLYFTGNPGCTAAPAIGFAHGTIEVTGWDPKEGRLSGNFQLWGWWDALPGLPNPIVYDGWFVAYR
jgi:hypothetical protein